MLTSGFQGVEFFVALSRVRFVVYMHALILNRLSFSASFPRTTLFTITFLRHSSFYSRSLFFFSVIPFSRIFRNANFSNVFFAHALIES